MSPILVRPVREQLEHDRVIRLLQAKNRRRYEAGMNPGTEQNVAVGSGPSAQYPDVVLQSTERGHRLQAVIEVETGESVNHLEALAQWTHFAKLRVPFQLFVPGGMIDVARRLCEDNQIPVTELWSYHFMGDQARFTLMHRSREAIAGLPRKRPPAPRAAPRRQKKPSRTSKPAARVVGKKKLAKKRAPRPRKRR